MEKRFLMAVDGSAPAVKAAGFGAELARRMEAQVTLVYVTPPMGVLPSSELVERTHMRSAEERYARHMLEEAMEVVRRAGLEPRVEILHGAVAETIADAAKAEDVTMVVVGSRGQGAVSRMLLGSVSDRLLHICPRPVLVVR